MDDSAEFEAMRKRAYLAGAVTIVVALLIILYAANTPKVDQVNQLPREPVWVRGPHPDAGPATSD